MSSEPSILTTSDALANMQACQTHCAMQGATRGHVVGFIETRRYSSGVSEHVFRVSCDGAVAEVYAHADGEHVFVQSVTVTGERVGPLYAAQDLANVFRAVRRAVEPNKPESQS